jgi:hypothetical protein
MKAIKIYFFACGMMYVVITSGQTNKPRPPLPPDAPPVVAEALEPPEPANLKDSMVNITHGIPIANGEPLVYPPAPPPPPPPPMPAKK